MKKKEYIFLGGRGGGVGYEIIEMKVIIINVMNTAGTGSHEI